MINSACIVQNTAVIAAQVHQNSGHNNQNPGHLNQNSGPMNLNSGQMNHNSVMNLNSGPMNLNAAQMMQNSGPMNLNNAQMMQNSGPMNLNVAQMALSQMNHNNGAMNLNAMQQGQMNQSYSNQQQPAPLNNHEINEVLTELNTSHHGHGPSSDESDKGKKKKGKKPKDPNNINSDRKKKEPMSEVEKLKTTFNMVERVYMLQLYWRHGGDHARHTRVTRDFMKRFPGRAPPTRQSLMRLNHKFEKTGSVLDRVKTGRPKSVMTLENRELVAQIFVESPEKSKKQAAEELNMSTASINRILAMNDDPEKKPPPKKKGPKPGSKRLPKQPGQEGSPPGKPRGPRKKKISTSEPAPQVQQIQNTHNSSNFVPNICHNSNSSHSSGMMMVPQGLHSHPQHQPPQPQPPTVVPTSSCTTFPNTDGPPANWHWTFAHKLYNGSEWKGGHPMNEPMNMNTAACQRTHQVPPKKNIASTVDIASTLSFM